jgi:hypothetical protein
MNRWLLLQVCRLSAWWLTVRGMSREAAQQKVQDELDLYMHRKKYGKE